MVPLFSSWMVPRCLLVFFLFTVTIATTTAQPLYTYCPNGATNYTANSTFESNLNQLFSTLAANGSATGFFNFTAGSVPDRVYGLVLCRGDVAAGPCSSCLSTATEGIVQQCPYQRSAVIWYDNCMLRYSNQPFFSIVDANFRVLMMNAQNVTATAVLNQQVEAMMAGLVRYAAYNSSAPRGFATGAAAYVEPALPRIFGLVQCTRDLSADDCSSCLGQITGEIKQRFSGRRGARTLTSSCNMRYELYSFYNSSENVIIPLPATAAPPAAGSLPPVGAPDARGENKKGVGTVLAIVIPVGIASALTCVICICFWRRKSRKKVLINTTDTQQVTPVESLLLDLSTLRAATGNFSDLNKLGEGGFGAVYKGLLPNGEEIAVKRLSRGSSQGIDELKNEVVLLAKLQHRNLVRLLGVCWEGEEKLLVYEFVPNTSLDSFLFDPTKVEQLHWETRYKIIEGIARGLQYLHEDSQHKIIHRDLKASNILLDADMNPKISDFGLARLFGGDQTQASTTRVVGTYGYMPPEYAMRGKFSNKTDVFSFGVLVLEIITGRKISSFFESESSADLLSWVWEHWANGAALDITDPSLGGNYQRSEVLKCIQIGLLCVQDAPSSRPTMSSVVLALSSFSMSLQVPSRPAFSIGNSQSFANVLDGSLEGSTGAQEGTTSGTALYSPNEVSVTELEPR